MSLILLSLAGGAGLWHVSRLEQFRKHKQQKKADPWKPGVAQRTELSTGTYGDISEIANTLHKRGFIVGERFDTDLTGVPCRWLIAQNGGVYKTYDTTTQFVFKC